MTDEQAQALVALDEAVRRVEEAGLPKWRLLRILEGYAEQMASELRAEGRLGQVS